MSSGFTLEPREGYLYVQLAPGFEMTPDATTRVWTAICETCRELNLRRALAEGDNVTRRLTHMEAFDIAGLAGRLLPGLSVACVLRGYVPDSQSEFFQTVALSRGVRMQFFPDLNSALRWLGAEVRPAG
ncbi:MAG TPA: hypothetical protein VJL86_13020 [Steroidobacteraceae bacterium]|nr:hypothetical protein [Steroidobacteraceae bacterium]